MKTNKLEIYYSNTELKLFVENEDEAYKIVSNLLNDPNISEDELDDLYVLYNDRDDIVIMVE